ncbi:TM2 domain-containing protein [Peribacillus sp. NPDC094092]|uniref:TM2 domain-containing protein n=1 Tax=Peribacillus sp. NPDC094092 TaxID=3390611 RepID=UPI003CFCE2F5
MKRNCLCLWWITGVWGGHRFYAGDTGMGIGMLLTFDGLGIWSLFAGFAIGKAIDRKNDTMEMEVMCYNKQETTAQKQNLLFKNRI